MKAYTVWYIWKDTLSNKVLAEFSFALVNRHELQKQRLFDSVEQCQNYLLGDKLTWFRTCIEDFLTMNKDQKENQHYKMCEEYYNVISDKSISLKKLCNSFLRGLEHFTGILPAVGTVNHEKQQENLRELIKFCNQETAN